jgi:hypothetical protein
MSGSASRPGRFHFEETARIGSRVNLDAVEKSLCPFRESNPDSCNVTRTIVIIDNTARVRCDDTH